MAREGVQSENKDKEVDQKNDKEPDIEFGRKLHRRALSSMPMETCNALVHDEDTENNLDLQKEPVPTIEFKKRKHRRNPSSMSGAT